MENNEKLSKEELLRLIQEYQNGNKSVGDQIIECNRHLVYRRINEKYYYLPREKEDLFQIGCLGMAKCLDTYDATKGEFSTYAIKFIDTEIRRYIRKIYQETKNDSLDRIVRSNKAEDAKETTLGELLQYKVDYDDKVYRSEVAKHLQEIVEDLPEMDQKIVNLSFGLTDGIPRPPHEIARLIAKDSTYVINRLMKILRNLKKELEKYKKVDSIEYNRRSSRKP